jgi:hypothetical protein
MPLKDYFHKGNHNVEEVISEFKISFVMLLISGYNNIKVSVVYIAFSANPASSSARVTDVTPMNSAR